MVCGLHLPSQLMSLAAWEAEWPDKEREPWAAIPKEHGGCRSLVVGSLASCRRAIVIVLVLDAQLSHAPPPGASSLSFCVTYIMPPRTILETSRPTCD